MNFLNDPSIATYNVGVTCQRCPISDCKERMAPPSILFQKEKDAKIDTIVEELNQKFS